MNSLSRCKRTDCSGGCFDPYCYGTDYSDLYPRPPILNQGRECPKCGKVYSPSTPSCYKCGEFTYSNHAGPLPTDNEQDEN